MATKNYMINDKWLDLDKQNIVELQSVDGELDSLKVNGSEIETPSGKITITENGTDIDIAQYALADVNVEGGGGSWQTVFEGNVTTEAGEMGNAGSIDYAEQLTAETLKITFDGIEYECEKISTITSNIYGGFGENGPDFSEYPFAIISTEDGNRVLTESVGTHSLKIESSESDGNFNVAELTVVNNTSTVRTIYAPVTLENGTTSGVIMMPNMGEVYVNVILGDEGCLIEFDTTSMVIECSGEITRQISNPNTFKMRDTATITIVRIEE